MNIAILGGGFTGLAAAYRLYKKHKVTIFEKEDILGGMAAGFKLSGWSWFLERTYHHIFTNDTDILSFANEVGYEEFFFHSPKTVSMYGKEYNYRTFPVDTPQDFLFFPLLTLPEKIRTGVVLLFLKTTPHLSLYEKETAKSFILKTMGERAWSVLWEELFRKKFGRYAENILASFIWARINKRTQQLGYASGGFQHLINHTTEHLTNNKVVLYTGEYVKKITKNKNGLDLLTNKKSQFFDVVISTLPTPVMVRISGEVFPKLYLHKLSQIQYLHGVSLIFETEEKVFPHEYWISVADKQTKTMALIQHTNFIDKKYYGGNNILYAANYVEQTDDLFTQSPEETSFYYTSYLKKIKKTFTTKRQVCLKTLYAQPIFNREFLTNKPTFQTPVKNLYIANLDMTFPYDRGTNYAVRLGREVARLLL